VSDYSPRAARLLFVVSLLSTIRKILALISHGGIIDSWAHPTSLGAPDTPTTTTTTTPDHLDDDEQLARDEALLAPGQSFAERWRPLHLVGNVLSLTQSVADDVECFGRLGVLPESRRRQADRVADATWFLSSAIDLVRVQSERGRIWSRGRRVRRQMVDGVPQVGGGRELTAEEEEAELVRVRACRRTLKGLRDRLYVLWWERVKLCADLIFSGPFVHTWPSRYSGADPKDVVVSLRHVRVPRGIRRRTRFLRSHQRCRRISSVLARSRTSGQEQSKSDVNSGVALAYMYISLGFAL
jgi:hypothetical protein